MLWAVSICFGQSLTCFFSYKYGNSVNSQPNWLILPPFFSISNSLSSHTFKHTLFGRHTSILGNQWCIEPILMILPPFFTKFQAPFKAAFRYTLFGNYPSIYGNFWSTGPNPMIWGVSGSSLGVLSVCRYVISTIYVIICKMCGIQMWIRGKRSHVISWPHSWDICKILTESRR